MKNKVKFYFILFDFQYRFIVAQKDNNVDFDQIDDSLFEFVTDEEIPLYSNKSDNYDIPKNLKKIEEVLGYHIFNHFDINKRIKSFDMITIYCV
jgi:hypothetical protein